MIQFTTSRYPKSSKRGQRLSLSSGMAKYVATTRTTSWANMQTDRSSGLSS